MTTLRQWFDEFSKRTNEHIESIVFGNTSWGDPWDGLPTTLVELGDVPDVVLDREFDSGYGGSQAPSFTAWSATKVLFPAVYDGAEWMTWVDRNPCNRATSHVGGE
jgi:hypothetical protein